MRTNRDVFLHDPTRTAIPNDGVTEVVTPRTDEQWRVLRYELAAFVCEGEYRRGLERILSNYLSHLTQPKQPAVWVSGFYGSGKSHMVRVLEYLWRDITFPDGVRARGLARLPEEIRDLLTEVSVVGRREGGLWSAAGTLAAGAGSVRLSLLSILFRSASLPEQYALARFIIWLRRNRHYDAVVAALHEYGTELATELDDFYISVPLAQSLIATGALPQSNPADVQSLLVAQYSPDREEISDDEFLRTVEDVLALQSETPGKLPCTLIVFDELQQFISEDPQRTLHVQNVVEACSSRFGSRLLFIATGQNALQATPQLSKLQGRFTVRVTLSDTDVDRVVREVVLQKKPSEENALRDVLDTARGEIDRHLVGTQIGARPSDAADLVADYPLLPVRRRFWERVLRAIDLGGTSSQLRSQLRIVHEAARSVTSAPIGTVVPADFIYDQQKIHMLQSGVLPSDIATAIATQNDGSPEGTLRARLCALVFLVGKLPTEGIAATSLTATIQNLADLLVDDLTRGSAALRQRVPEALQQLVERNILMLVDDQYRLQTTESKAWEDEYQRRYRAIVDDDSRIAGDRANMLREAVLTVRKGLTFTQGASKTARKFEFSFGVDAPQTDTDIVPVWVRDGWTVTETMVRDEAQTAGSDSPLVFVFLPRRNATELRHALVGSAAARETLAVRPVTANADGIEAQSAMRSRGEIERRKLDLLLADVITHALVFKGGGSAVQEGTLQDSLRIAIESALVRLFPQFGIADHIGWNTVVARAGNGAADALVALSYTGDAAQHPACRAVRAFIGSNGKKGSEVRRHFTGAGYGWQQDAADGVLLVLVAAGLARAARNGLPQRATEIARPQLGQTDFISEGITVTMGQRIALRKFVTDVGLPVKNGEEGAALPLVLQRLGELANEAGGAPPRPARPDTTLIEQVRGLAGNEQIITVYEQREELLERFTAWTRARQQIAERMPAWELLERLLRHAANLPIATEVAPQTEAIVARRMLLAEPNPVPPLLAQLAGTTRAALQAARERLCRAREQELAALETSVEWQRLVQDERQRLIQRHALGPVAELRVGTDDELLTTLDATPLADWEDKLAALAGRMAQAREGAARLLEPKAVTIELPRRTLRTVAEVDEYLAQVRSALIEQIDAGNPVIV